MDTENVFIRKLGDINDEIYIKDQIDTILNFNLKDLGQRAEITYAMTTPELLDYRFKEETKETLLPKLILVDMNALLIHLPLTYLL